MFTSTSQEFSGANFSSSKRTSTNNLLAILFFFLGAPHIYSAIQRGGSQGKSLKIKSDKIASSAQISNVLRFSPSHFLSILFMGAIATGTMEILRTIAK